MGNNVSFGHEAIVELGSQVGENSDIGAHSRILYGVRLAPGSVIPSKTIIMPHYPTSFLLQNIRPFIPNPE